MAASDKQLALIDNKHDQPLSPSATFLQDNFRRFGINSGEKGKVDTKGPLGLNLLHEPLHPQVDFVFVHGLGGGSRKTWSYSAEPGTFWPKEWLPAEAGFSHVRIHSYGYNSDWATKKESLLTVHDFGQALTADLYNSPHLRRSDTPIVFVAHSMGGLVVKKAYLIATGEPKYSTIARRIHAMYFLGTPHRGADLVQFARIARSSVGSGIKAFVNDLLPGSATLDQINDEFRSTCRNIRLFSLFEGVPTSLGPVSSLIVTKESAVLGLPGEHVQYMEADHRHLCKFDSPMSTNYILLRRSFATTLEELQLQDRATTQNRSEYKSHMKKISSFLGSFDRQDALLRAINDNQHPGSCEWLTKDEAFQTWINGLNTMKDLNSAQVTPGSETPRILWLHGRPGTGKSVASSHVINHLRTREINPSFYFFRHDDKAGSTVSSFIRALAFQMAESNPEVRHAIVAMIDDDVTHHHNDYRMLWDELFAERILKLKLAVPKFWVLDAVDECAGGGASALAKLFSQLRTAISVRVFITGRSEVQLERLLTVETINLVEVTTGGTGSLNDIELFLRARRPPTFGDEACSNFIADVLGRSNGIFLWVSLTMTQLDHIYSTEDMRETLQAVPSEMDDFYSRIINNVLASPNSEIARSILTWVICAPKPVLIEELVGAVKQDIGRTLIASPRQLEAIAGSLIFVDDHARVHITHQTTSTFLTRPREGFWIDRTAAHPRIAQVCLGVLCGDDFRPPWHRRRRGPQVKKATSTPFSVYSAAQFVHHLVLGPPIIDTSLALLDKFLRSNVLTWIERVAESGDLSCLQQTANGLQHYLAQLENRHTPTEECQVQMVQKWATELHRLVGAFHAAILTMPSSIHYLLPHLCPRNSATRELFANPTKGLTITGPLDESWNDRLTCHLFQEETLIMALCQRFVAVGLRNGEIHFFQARTFESVAAIPLEGKIRLLAFDTTSSFLVVCQYGKLKLWDVRRLNGSSIACLWEQPLDFAPYRVKFSLNGTAIMLYNTLGSEFVLVSAADGCRADPILLREPSTQGLPHARSDGRDRWTWSPERIELDASHKLAAASYLDSSVALWDLEAGEMIGIFKQEGLENVILSPPALDMVFHPVPEAELLAISYNDWTLVTCNPWTLEQTSKQVTPYSLDHLATSSDGRLLAGGDDAGTIHLFLFESLQPLYRIPPPHNSGRLQGISFSFDNKHLIDIRDQRYSVWQPLALVSQEWRDEGLQNEAVERRTSDSAWGKHPDISSILPTGGRQIFAGKRGCAVDICDKNAADASYKLTSKFLASWHDLIRHMEWHEGAGLLLSVALSKCTITQLSFSDGCTRVENAALALEYRGHISQALLSPDATSLLIRTQSTLKLIAVDGGSVICELELPCIFCASHPSNPTILIAIQTESIHLLDWLTLTNLTPDNGIPIRLRDVAPGITQTWVRYPSSNFIVQILEPPQPSRPTALIAFDASTLTPETEVMEPQVLSLQTLGVRVRKLVGLLGPTLYFMDMAGWVSSIALGDLGRVTHYTRHFFIPPTWLTVGEGDVAISLVSKTEVAFGKGEGLIVFRGFLEFEEKVALEGN